MAKQGVAAIVKAKIFLRAIMDRQISNQPYPKGKKITRYVTMGILILITCLYILLSDPIKFQKTIPLQTLIILNQNRQKK